MPDNSQKIILLVEDEILIALTEKKQLEHYGYAVRTVHNGEKAIEAVTTASDIDLILMDINLGDGLDGTETAEIILKNHDIPIVFVSSHTEPEIVEKTEKITSYGYVVKNSSITVLDASIKMAFKLFDAKVVTQRKETLIHEHEEKYRLLHEYAGVAIAYYSPQGIVLSYNQLAAKNMGGVPDDFTGKSIFDLFPKPDVDIYYVRIQKASFSDFPDVYEDVVSLPTGNVHFLSTFTKIMDINNNLMGIQIISQNITNQKKMEETLQFKNEEYETVNEELRSTTEELQIQNGELIQSKELLLQKEKRLLQLEKVARIGSWTLNLNNKTIIASSVAEEIYGVEFTKLPLAVVQKITLLQYRPALDKALSDLVTKNAKYDIEFKICRPSDNKIIDIHSVATYDERSNTVFGIIQDITEHKLLEADLISQRKLYEEILEQSLAGYWDWDIPTGNEYLSPTFKKMFGYEVNEIENRADSWQKLIFAEDLPCVYDKFNLHVESKGKTPFYNEVRYHHKNGSTVWVICTGKVIEWDDAGKAKRMIGCHIDITERKKLEESLRESKQKAELLLNVAAEIIISLDSQGDITLLNESGHRILGYKSPELVGKNWFDTCLPIEDKEEIRKYFGLLLEGKSTLVVTHESDVVTLDGVRKTILWHNFLLKDKDGKAIGLFSSGEDITESKKAAEVLKERTEQLKKVQEITHVGSWYLNTETNDVTWTEELYKMYGFDPTKPVPPYTEHMKLFTAESWDVLSVSLAKTAKTGIPYELELVTVRKDGSNGWMWVRGEAVKDEKKIIGLWGAAQDITERKKTEEKIQILLSEKNTILKEVHHRIKNNMNTVSSLLTLQANATKDQTLIAALDDAKSRINSMSLLYDKLYRSSDYTEMSVKVYLSSLVDEVVANFPNSKMVKVEKNLQDFDLDVKRLQPLGIMINELITNTMKYAFVVKECGHIAVSAIRNDNRIIVSVQDDGIGIPESVSFENSTGFGLQLVYTLAQQLDGSIRIERGNGARVVIEFND